MKDIKTFSIFDTPCVDLKRIGSFIKYLRISNHLTVKDLQDFFGFDYPNAIYDWEKGLKLPNISNLIALSILYEVSIDKILLSNEQDFVLSRFFKLSLNYKFNK